MVRILGVFLALSAFAQSPDLASRTRDYLIELIRRDTTSPPGNETRAAEYLREIAERYGIEHELLGDDPARLNFIARLRGSGAKRPLLLMAHTDVVPADESQWSLPPFEAAVRDGYIYGRGSQDDKSLLAAEVAVLVDLKLRGVKLDRDIILLAEADEESGSSGIRWLIQNAWPKIEAEFGLNEGGQAVSLRAGPLFEIQTAEKVPTRVKLVARGTAGHGSVPRADNAVVHLSRAILRLAEANQPVRLNATTRRYLREISKTAEYGWLEPLLGDLEENPAAIAAASLIRAHDAQVDASLHTTVSPTMLSSGTKVNVIPNTAEAAIDVRRLPNETAAEVFARFRRIVNDSAVEVQPAGGQEMPATEPSSLTSELYLTIERVLAATAPGAVVTPFMSRGATDAAFLREKGVAVYGVPLFVNEQGENRAHGNDERISETTLADGARLLWQIVLKTAAGRNDVRSQ